MSLIALYAACMTAGGGFVLLSIFAGGDHEHDFDAGGDLELDFDADFDADVGHGVVPSDADIGHGYQRERALARSGGLSPSQPPFRPLRSFRFWTFGLTFFGLTGLLASVVLTVGVLAELALALPLGFLIGLGASYGIHRLSADQSGSMTRSDRMLGQEGVVRVAVRGQTPGEVKLKIGERTLVLLATSDAPEPIVAGDTVVVVGFDGHRARVVRSATFMNEEEI